MQATSLSALRNLEIGGSEDLDAEGLAPLFSAPWISQLEKLDIRNRKLGDAIMSTLAAAPLGNLKSLTIDDDQITAQGLATLLASDNVGQLTELSLDDNKLGPEGAKLIADCAKLAKLDTLSLNDCDIGDEGAKALAASPHLKNTEISGVGT